MRKKINSQTPPDKSRSEPNVLFVDELIVGDALHDGAWEQFLDTKKLPQTQYNSG